MYSKVFYVICLCLPGLVYLNDEFQQHQDNVAIDSTNQEAIAPLQVGKWIAQWDAPYEAWYYYNSESGVSTWSKPSELEGIEFTEPVPEINNAKNRVNAAHIQHENKIKEEQNQKGGENSVRLERDKPFDPFGLTKDSQTHGNHHHQQHNHQNHQHHRQPSQSPLNFGFT